VGAFMPVGDLFFCTGNPFLLPATIGGTLARVGTLQCLLFEGFDSCPRTAGFASGMERALLCLVENPMVQKTPNRILLG